MDTEIKWRAPEFRYYSKSSSWYYWIIFATLLFLGFAVWQRNFLFGFFMVVAGTLMLSWGGKKPREIDFSLGEKGLTIDAQKPYPYTELKSFAEIEAGPEESPYAEFRIYFKRQLRTGISILVPKERSAQVSEMLGGQLSKTEPELTILDALQRIIRF
jgi:hypothetical protein